MRPTGFHHYQFNTEKKQRHQCNVYTNETTGLQTWHKYIAGLNSQICSQQQISLQIPLLIQYVNICTLISIYTQNEYQHIIYVNTHNKKLFIRSRDLTLRPMLYCVDPLSQSCVSFPLTLHSLFFFFYLSIFFSLNNLIQHSNHAPSTFSFLSVHVGISYHVFLQPMWLICSFTQYQFGFHPSYITQLEL